MDNAKIIVLPVYQLKKDLQAIVNDLWDKNAPEMLAKGFSKYEIAEMITETILMALNKADNSGEWTIKIMEKADAVAGSGR